MLPVELDTLRQEVAKESDEVTWVKPDINAALEALDTWWVTSGRADAASAIEIVSPAIFNNTQKKRIGKFWLRHKFNGGG